MASILEDSPEAIDVIDPVAPVQLIRIPKVTTTSRIPTATTALVLKAFKEAIPRPTGRIEIR